MAKVIFNVVYAGDFGLILNEIVVICDKFLLRNYDTELWKG